MMINSQIDYPKIQKQTQSLLQLMLKKKLKMVSCLTFPSNVNNWLKAVTHGSPWKGKKIYPILLLILQVEDLFWMIREYLLYKIVKKIVRYLRFNRNRNWVLIKEMEINQDIVPHFKMKLMEEDPNIWMIINNNIR